MTRKTYYQIVKYGIVGVLNASADYAVLNISILLIGLNLFWSVLFGFLVGGILGYFLHSKWTFQYDTTNKNIQKFSQFIFVSLVNFGMTEFLMHYLTNNLGIYYNFSKLITIIIGFVLSFLLIKFWVFNQEDNKKAGYEK